MNFYKLYQGNCLSVLEDIDFDVVITDPPYGLNFNYNTYNDTKENLVKLISDFMPIIKKKCDRIYIMCGITQISLYPKPDWVLAVTWNTTGSFGKYGYTQWMPILAYGDDLPGFGNVNQVTKTDVFKISGGSGVGFMRSKKEKEHTCPKPLNIMKQVVNRLTEKNDVVCDPFIGSGTTMYTCQDLGRSCIGIDIDEKYCELTKKRCFTRRFLDREVEYDFIRKKGE